MELGFARPGNGILPWPPILRHSQKRVEASKIAANCLVGRPAPGPKAGTNTNFQCGLFPVSPSLMAPHGPF